MKVVKSRGEVRPIREKRSWTPVINAIVANIGTDRKVFASRDEVDVNDVKYLTLALQRRARGERLRTRLAVHDGVDGRFLWAERVTDEPVAVEPEFTMVGADGDAGA